MATPLSRWQFSLKALFAAIGIVAVCSALIARLALIGGCLSIVFICLWIAALALFRTERQVACAGIGLIVLCGVILFVDSQRIYRGGYVTISATVKVTDSESGESISAARVSVDDRSFKPKYLSRTDIFGSARITAQLISYENASRRVMQPHVPYAVHLDKYLLAVDADGYEPIRMPLSTATGSKEWPGDGTPLPPFTVELRPKRP